MGKYDTPMMETAYIWALESYCRRKQVGCVIAKDSRVISCGYNGTISGSENCCEEIDPNGKTQTKDTVLHAEENTIAFAARNGIPTKGCTMYITLAPCIRCSRLIIQAGIKKVVYGQDYNNAGINFLRENGIKVKKLEIYQ